MTDFIDKMCRDLYKSDCLLKKCFTYKNCSQKFKDFDENKSIFLNKSMCEMNLLCKKKSQQGNQEKTCGEILSSDLMK